MRRACGLLLCCLGVVACGPGRADEAGDTVDTVDGGDVEAGTTGPGETGDETGDEPVGCLEWTGPFTLIASFAAGEAEMAEGLASVLIPDATGEGPWIIAFERDTSLIPISGYRARALRVAPAGTIQVHATSVADDGPQPLDALAFALPAPGASLIVAAYKDHYLAGDVGVTEYGVGLWSVATDVVTREDTFDSYRSNYVPAFSAAMIEPGTVDFHFDAADQNSTNHTLHLRHELGVTTELPELAYTDGPRALLRTDLNGDGALDLALAGDDAQLYLVWAESPEGALDFGGASSLETGWPGVALAAGDVDDDGMPELAIVTQRDSSDAIEIRSGLTSPTPGVMLEQDTAFVLGAGEWGSSPRVQIVDLDGDALDDLLWVEAAEYPPESMALMARRSCGDGSFGEARVLAEFDARVTNVHVVDFSEDGVPDLVVNLVEGNTVTTLIGG